MISISKNKIFNSPYPVIIVLKEENMITNLMIKA